MKFLVGFTIHNKISKPFFLNLQQKKPSKSSGNLKKKKAVKTAANEMSKF